MDEPLAALSATAHHPLLILPVFLLRQANRYSQACVTFCLQLIFAFLRRSLDRHRCGDFILRPQGRNINGYPLSLAIMNIRAGVLLPCMEHKY